MLNGGYKIIDLQGVALSGEAVIIDGIYEAIEGNFGKAIMLSGFNVGGIEKDDVFVNVNVDSGNFVIEVYGQKLTITDGDEVTIKEVEGFSAYEIFDFTLASTTATLANSKTKTDLKDCFLSGKIPILRDKSSKNLYWLEQHSYLDTTPTVAAEFIHTELKQNDAIIKASGMRVKFITDGPANTGTYTAANY